MSSNRCVVLFGFVAFLVAPVAVAELPSLSGGTMPHNQPIDTDGRFAWFEDLREGKLRLAFAAVDYRFATSGLETQWRVAGRTARAVVSYAGERRLETAWQAPGGMLKFAVTSGQRSSGYRIEFVRDF